jgi:hypothetical protein
MDQFPDLLSPAADEVSVIVSAPNGATSVSKTSFCIKFQIWPNTLTDPDCTGFPTAIAVQPSPAAEPTSALIVDVNEAATIFGSKKLEEVQVAADAI